VIMMGDQPGQVPAFAVPGPHRLIDGVEHELAGHVVATTAKMRRA